MSIYVLLLGRERGEYSHIQNYLCPRHQLPVITGCLLQLFTLHTVMLLRYVKPRLLQSYLPVYRFSKKGFGNFERNKKPAPNNLQTDVNGKQTLNIQKPSPDINHSAQEQKDHAQGFMNFQRGEQRNIFNKELFEKLKKNSEQLTKQIEKATATAKTNESKDQEKTKVQSEEEKESEQEQTAEQKSKRIPRYKLTLLLFASGLSMVTAIYYTLKYFYSNPPVEIIYSEVIEMIKNENVKSVFLNPLMEFRNRIQLRIVDKEGNVFISKTQDQDVLLRHIGKYNETHTDKISVVLQPNHTLVLDKNSLKGAMAWLINIGLLFFAFRSMGSMGNKAAQKGAGKSAKGMFSMEETYGKDNKVRKTVNVKFKDVAGMTTPKKEITEFVQFLKHPEKFRRLGARIPRGALLTGPPGTGKTLLAKACAGQSKVSFFSTSGSEFVQKFVGVGAARVRHLFAEAKASAPSIIFIDEIDAVGRKRWKHAIGGNDERDSTLNQLLVEMDGFGTQQNVVVFAATNRKQMLDDALLRPGRFDRIIEIQLPDLEERYEMFLVHLSPLKLHQSISNLSVIAQRMSMLTPGFSGADIFNVCNEAAILAARDNRDHVLMVDFENACDRIIAGTVKRNVLSEEERKVVAYHESGHAVVSWFLEGANPLLKLTVVPRSKGSLGFAQYLPSDKKIFSKQNIIDQLTVILGGRASEMQFFGKLTTGAADDLQKASELAYNMIKQYGMGAALFNRNSSQTEYMKQYSEYTGGKIDAQVRTLVSQALKKARELILVHKQKILNLAELLLKEQTLDTTQIQSILGERPFLQSESYKNFLSKV